MRIKILRMRASRRDSKTFEMVLVKTIGETALVTSGWEMGGVLDFLQNVLKVKSY